MRNRQMLSGEQGLPEWSTAPRSQVHCLGWGLSAQPSCHSLFLCSPPGPPASISSRHVPAVATNGSLSTCPSSPKLRRGCSPSIHQCR